MRPCGASTTRFGDLGALRAEQARNGGDRLRRSDRASVEALDRTVARFGAALCGVSPVPASSGKVVRHRLNRGGDRAANSALHIIAIGRLRTDPRSKDYVARRIAESHSKLEAIRCLKRYIAREVFALISQRRHEILQTQITS